MKTHSRTPQQRDRSFARVRHLTRTVFIGSGVASTVMLGFIASRAAPTVSIPSKAPTTVPITTTTVCYAKPPGGTTCS